MAEEPVRRKFLKTVGFASVLVAVPLVADVGSAVAPAESGPKGVLTQEERLAWRERRKKIVAGFEPRYEEPFP